jgi:hypothetical protein
MGVISVFFKFLLEERRREEGLKERGYGGESENVTLYVKRWP